MIIRLAEGGDPKIEGDGDEDAPGGGERGTEVGRRSPGRRDNVLHRRHIVHLSQRRQGRPSNGNGGRASAGTGIRRREGERRGGAPAATRGGGVMI